MHQASLVLLQLRELRQLHRREYRVKLRHDAVSRQQKIW
jgi:hypothetical protein